jgi:hypothetical protein
MKRIFAFSLFLLIISYCYSQRPNFKLGKIDKAELSVNTCDLDSTAEAYYIGDLGNVYFTVDGEGIKTVFERHFRMKILKKTGLDWAHFSIPVWGTNFYIDVKGFTYNLENGEIQKEKLSKDAIYKEKYTKKSSLVKFALPKVKEGSIIEVYYKITSPSSEIPDWDFQYGIPVKYSEYEVLIPEYFNYKRFQNGYEKLQVKSEQENGSFNFGQGYTLTFTSNKDVYTAINVPAFKTEPYLTSSRNYISSIEFELQSYQFPREMLKDFRTDWNSISKELMDDDDFGGQLNRSGFVKDQVATLTANCATPYAKMKVIYDYLKTYIKWNEYRSKYASQSLKKAYENKSGNCAEINLLLIVMLREAGLKSDPALLSTRDNGIQLIEFPVLQKFNYVIATVSIDGKTYLLDATEPNCPLGVLPERCLNGAARVISNTEGRTITITPIANDSETTIIQSSLDDNGNINGTMQKQYKGYAAIDFRNNLANNKSREDYIKHYQDNHEGLSVDTFSFVDVDSIYKPASLNFAKMTIAGKAENNGNLLTINPLLYEQMSSNPFKIEERKYPVDYGHKMEDTYVFQFDIPKGYVVDELPKPITDRKSVV